MMAKNSFSTTEPLADENARENVTHHFSIISFSHATTAMISVGVFALPFAMAYLGWGLGITFLVLLWIITLFTALQMMRMHEMIPGKRLNKYHELGQVAVGERLGWWIVVPQQVIMGMGVSIIRLLVASQSIVYIFKLLANSSTFNHPGTHPKEYCTSGSGSYKCHIISTLTVAVIRLVVAQYPHMGLTRLDGVSFGAALYAISHSSILWVDFAASGPGHTQSKVYDVNFGRAKSTAPSSFRVIDALGIMTFAFSCHNLLLEIQATIPFKSNTSSQVHMWKGIVATYIVGALCYFPVASFGYWAFGNILLEGPVQGPNILLLFKVPVWLGLIIFISVFGQMLHSSMVCEAPNLELIETLLVEKFLFKSSITVKRVIRSIYLVFIAFVACMVPLFNHFLGFFGGVFGALNTLVLPCIFWLKVYKPKSFGVSWTINWICIFAGIALTLASLVGAIYSVVSS